MGSTHSVCQDYAATSVSPNTGVRVAVSDGCSSAPHTDFGARFLVRAALSQELRDSEILLAATRMRSAASLSWRALQATLLVANLETSGELITYRAGDGVQVHRFRNGEVFYEHVAYDANTPAYLSYLLNEDDRKTFLETVPGCTLTFGARTPEGVWSTTSRRETPARLGGDGQSFDSKEIDLVLLFTDGIESFQNPDGSVVPIETILDEILSIKNYKGEFLARRCSRFLAKTCAERGWKHADDFAVAGLYLGEGD